MQAVGVWNEAGAIVMADSNNPALDAQHFADRTDFERSMMHASVSAMEKALLTMPNAAIATAMSAVVRNYKATIDAIDDLAAAVSFDPPRMADAEAAVASWQEADARKQPAALALLDAMEPHLTADEYEALRKAVAGMRG